MRRVLPLLAVFCFISLAACVGTSNTDPTGIHPASQLDYLDRQRVELQSCLARYEGTQIERIGNSVCITIGCDSLFESNSDRMRLASRTAIDTVADVLKKYPETNVRVDVHTDCIRSEEENLALSELQAWVIKKVLVDNGVTSSRVAARGWGESKPVLSNANEEGRRANRRVTITLMQKKS